MKCNYGIAPLMEMVELLMVKQKSYESLISVFCVSSAFGRKQAAVFNYSKILKLEFLVPPSTQISQHFKRLQQKGNLTLSATEKIEEAEGS